jgi:uncharacterized membrane protein YdjX (TVP38/TMEM64 family)
MRWRPLVFGLVVAAVVWAYWGLDLPRRMSVEGMRALVESHAPYGPLFFMAMVVAGIFTHVPMMAHLLMAIGGVVLGGRSAFAYGWVAALVGATATFLLVRYLARAQVQRALSGRLARLRGLDERLARNGFWTVFGLRLLFFLAPPLNWELGLTGVAVRHYVAGTALGIVPQLATTVFFAGAVAPSSGVVSRKVAVGAMLALAVVAAASIARRLLRNSR